MSFFSDKRRHNIYFRIKSCMFGFLKHWINIVTALFLECIDSGTVLCQPRVSLVVFFPLELSGSGTAVYHHITRTTLIYRPQLLLFSTKHLLVMKR